MHPTLLHSTQKISINFFAMLHSNGQIKIHELLICCNGCFKSCRFRWNWFWLDLRERPSLPWQMLVELKRAKMEKMKLTLLLD
jgi:hypothetical protein